MCVILRTCRPSLAGTSGELPSDLRCLPVHCPRPHLYSLLSVKVDSLLGRGGGGGGGVESRDQHRAPDLASIKNTEATILQQISGLRSVHGYEVWL